ncbi:glutamate--cysteine ligase [Arthrobacter sp. I2-34]|uniref:Putative glutamate--cysteine ligase 2 n=1 Tax=Arthrobacter hankyongi TaxID=2904801 RepID=A0ABS9L7L3_9MICC|nr:glutamate--cysteine ligase [Arthrobacter hankyongi]MCG2622658.1 glutamate--cysteine ligase [Arthrobacter hankyongi]
MHHPANAAAAAATGARQVVPTIGVEEEYLLLDPHSAKPAAVADTVAAYLEGSAVVARGDIQRELLSCQIETATSVCSTLTEAEESLLNFRRSLAAAARKAGVRAAATATAPSIDESFPEVTDKPRYHQLKASAKGIVADQFINGQHVHVEVPDRETGVQVLNRIRPWLPAIIAVSANSPFWQGRDSGFASWRTINYRRWPLQGCPPVFADAADYERRIQRLVDTSVIIDRGVLTWIARLSDHYPTVEVRAADVQLRAQDAVLLAALIRGLVSTAAAEAARGLPCPEPDAEVLDAAVWQAGRHGMAGKLIDPLAGVLLPAEMVLAQLLRHIRPALEEAGETEWVDASLAEVRADGTGAERQRKAMEQGGMPALLDLYANSLTAEP